MGFRPKLDAEGKPYESVDELPPWRQLIPLGLQHVLALYAGAVAVPLVVGGALIAMPANSIRTIWVISSPPTCSWPVSPP